MDLKITKAEPVPGMTGSESPFSKNATQVTERKGQTLGDQLNRMAGVTTEKNLWEEKKNEMGKDAFLKMFMEQLKYQDPMNPVKNEQFSQQMAMFGQLEQQMNTNKNLEKIISQQGNMQIAALQLVGKEITADRAALYHEKNKFSGMSFKVPTDVSELKVEIIDPFGETVRAYNLGAQSQGDINWKWDGNKDNGQPAESGRYVYKLTGKDFDGKPININSKVDGKVTGVTSAQGQVYLLVGDQKIGLSDVEIIKDSAAQGQVQGPNGVAKNPAAPQASNVSANPTDVEKLVGTNPEGELVGPEWAEEEEVTDKGQLLRRQKIGSDRMDPLSPLYLR